MKVGTILLSKNNKYLSASGLLPKRPKYDKQLLTELLAYNGKVSSCGYNLLPNSIKALVTIDNNNYTPITIKELATCELLIVSKSKEKIKDGKTFRLKNFNRLIKTKKVDLWIKEK